MSADRLVARWRGVLLTLVAVVATVWLAATGRLELYIHPRYTVFTIVMALVAGALALAALLLLPGREAHEDDEEEGAPRRPATRWATLVATALVLVGAVAALLVAPPGTLSTTGSRGQDAAALAAVPVGSAPRLAGGDSTSFTVKDWSTMLRDGADASDLARMPADVTGFVIAGEEPDVYYLARFLITCCAVDAQPIGVPVYDPGWRDRIAEGDWLELAGTFRSAPDASLSEPIVLVPDAATPIDEPAQPYVY